MSAEPARTVAYSCDLRMRVVWQRIGMGLSFRSIARNLNVSVGTVSNIISLFERTGEVKPKPPGPRPDLRKLDERDELSIIGMVMQNPNMRLLEICKEIEVHAGVSVSASTICRLLKKYHFSRKKLQFIPTQRNPNYRAAFMAEVVSYPREMLVWVDETGCDMRDTMRLYGYSLIGQRAICHHTYVRGKRVSTIAALSTNGIIAKDFLQGTCSGEEYFDFLRGSLIPQMLPFDGINPNSILIMDNCSVHHTDEVTGLLQDSGILVLYLPPYSPDFNPIEETFSYVKHYLKEHDSVADAFRGPTELLKAAFESVTPEYGNAWITDCGYSF